MAEPTIDLSKIQEYTGITADTTEGFIEAFNKKFITEEQIFKDKATGDRIFGRAFGAATTGVKQHFDQFGVEITGDDLKQPLEAVVKLGLTKAEEKWQARFAELERAAGLSADEKLKELNDALAKKDAKLTDYQKLLKEKATDFENLQASQKQEFKKFKVGSVYKDVQGSITWNPEKDEYSKVGFLTTMQDKYQIDLDENDEPFIVEKKSGSRIKAEGSHSTFMTPQEVYKQEAIKAGLMAINKKAGQPANQPPRAAEPPANNPADPTANRFRRPMANTRFNAGK